MAQIDVNQSAIDLFALYQGARLVGVSRAGHDCSARLLDRGGLIGCQVIIVLDDKDALAVAAARP